MSPCVGGSFYLAPHTFHMVTFLFPEMYLLGFPKHSFVEGYLGFGLFANVYFTLCLKNNFSVFFFSSSTVIFSGL